MAESLAQAAPVRVCEDGTRLLRQAPLETLLCHWVGSVPFALALLTVWSDITQPRFPDLRCALETLLLALVWIWMHCWRAVFAGRLRRQLSGIPPTPWTWRRIRCVALTQAFVAGSKLVVLPLGLFSVVLSARTVSAYRYSAVLGDREDLDAMALSAAARRLARVHTRLGWGMMAPLVLFRSIALLNVAVTLGALPTMVRVLTGYESAFSRSGVLFVATPLFLLLAFLATWLVTDPLIQAAYTLRCFEAESLETGEDVLASLRRIRSLAAAAVLLLAFVPAMVGRTTHVAQPLLAAAPVFPPSAGDLVAGDSPWGRRFRLPAPAQAPQTDLWADTPEAPILTPTKSEAQAPSIPAVTPPDLDRSIRRAVESPVYNWRFPPPASAVKGTPWIVAVTDRVLSALKSVVKFLVKAIGKILEFIFGPLLKGPIPGQGVAPARTLNRSLYVLIALAAAVALWFFWRAQQRRKTANIRLSSAGAVAVQLEDEGLTADRLPEAEWLEMGERCLLEDNPRLALRAFYLASLAWLGQDRWIALHAAKTNREYELELRRKARAFPTVREPFADNMLAFERVWYGQHAVSAAGVAEFRARIAAMKALLVTPEVAA